MVASLSKPHVSSFVASSGAIALSGPVSEWLFASGFWDRVNSTLGMMLNQYEDDEIAVEKLGPIVDFMGSYLAEIEGDQAKEYQFTYAWTTDGKALQLSVAKAQLTSELGGAAAFLSASAASNDKVVFDL